MDQVIDGLENTFVYVDDIIVYTDTYEHHAEVLRRLFLCLSNNGVVINRDKMSFFQQQVNYLEFKITNEGYKPLGIEAIGTSATKKQVKKFLGIVNYYRQHIPGLA